ncbi:MAG TPA: FAD-dependent oxidoreductase [Sphingomicrobium sp.]
MGAQGAASGPDFSAGIPIDDIPEGKTVAGRVGDEPVLLSRFDGELVAVSGGCTHYGAPLRDGLFDGETVRCPWHHACFSLRTGAALRAPALDPLDRWQVDVEGGRAFVRSRMDAAPGPGGAAPAEVERVVIVGGGAAGLACASELRRLGYAGAITMVSADNDPPCDRPNLSKDYLAGTAPEEWLPLRPADWYEQNRIELRLGAEVQRIDAAERRVHLGGAELPYDRLLLATGSEPNRLREPGFDADNVFTLRSLTDATAIAEQAKAGGRAAIVGSSFIGMEAAAALRKRGVEVTVVAPEHVPFERVFGAEIGGWLQRLHEKNGVRFHLGTVASSLEGRQLKLANGESVEADFVLVGIGVRPRAELAQAAGIPADGAVPVDAFLETSLRGVFAAGDIAAYPDALTGEPVRIEHWVHAERQGQIAAANMLGQRKRFDAVPFFWTEQFGVALRYVGHASSWDRVEVDGDIEGGDFIARYYEGGDHRASAAVGRDLEILEDERGFERMIADKSAKSGEPRETAGIESA